MKKKDLIVVIIIVIIILVLFGGIVYFNFIDKEQNNIIDNGKNEDKMIFKDISFIDTMSPNFIKVYDNNYIINGNKLYNLDGKMLFDGSNYDSIYYHNGYIIVVKDNKYGVIGKNLKVLIPVEYNNITVMSDNCFILTKKNNKDVLISNIYNPKNKKEYGPFVNLVYYNDNLIKVDKYNGNDFNSIGGSESNKLETYLLDVLNNKLERKSNLDNYYFSPNSSFQDNYIIASKIVDFKGFMKVLLDKKGNEVNGSFYNDMKNINDKLLLVKENGLYRLINKDNKTILSITNNEYENVYVEENIIVIEYKDNSIEYYDLQGNLINKTFDEYSYIDYIGDSKYILNASNKCVYIDYENKLDKKEIDYSYCEDFLGKNEKGYVVKKVGKDRYLYNNKLEHVFKNKYGDISLYNQYSIVIENGKYRVLSYNEEMLIDKEFINYWPLSDNEVILSDDANIYYLKY